MRIDSDRSRELTSSNESSFRPERGEENGRVGGRGRISERIRPERDVDDARLNKEPCPLETRSERSLDRVGGDPPRRRTERVRGRIEEKDGILESQLAARLRSRFRRQRRRGIRSEGNEDALGEGGEKGVVRSCWRGFKDGGGSEVKSRGELGRGGRGGIEVGGSRIQWVGIQPWKKLSVSKGPSTCVWW